MSAVRPHCRGRRRDPQAVQPYRPGPGEWHSYWTADLDTRSPDYAYVYHWYADGGANNCLASKNHAYVRCVHDPIRK